MFFKNPALTCDYYKIAHPFMQPPGTTRVFSTWTARNSKHHPDCPNTVVFGYQYTIPNCLNAFFKENFFNIPLEELRDEYVSMIKDTFSDNYTDFARFEALHKLGYLPIAIYGVPEGTILPTGMPDHVIYNTKPEFAWLPQYLEDIWSANNWLPSTSATTAYYRAKLIKKFADATCDNPAEVTRHMCGDFSMRGHTSVDSAVISGAAHGLIFDRTATILSNSLLSDYYLANPGELMRGTPSLEHSVVEQGVAWMRNRIADGSVPEYCRPYLKKAMADGTWETNLVAEMCFILYLIKEVQPTGVMTYVSDTYDFWGVISKVLPLIKDEILKRKGCFSVRPDSGDPFTIVCGNKNAGINTPAYNGAMAELFKTFGYTKNGKGCSVLPPQVRLIYGDAITYEITEDICAYFKAAGWSLENICFGIGAYTYQYVTRDTRGYAIKATYCEHKEFGPTPIFKCPKTAAWKASLKGCCVVNKTDNGYEVVDNLDFNEFLDAVISERSAYVLKFEDGLLHNLEDFTTIRNRLEKEGNLN